MGVKFLRDVLNLDAWLDSSRCERSAWQLRAWVGIASTYSYH